MIGLVLTIRYRQPLLLTGIIFVLIFIASLDGRLRSRVAEDQGQTTG
jgi:benzoate membrane transport protein